MLTDSTEVVHCWSIATRPTQCTGAGQSTFLQPPSGSDAESLDRRSVPRCRYVLGVADVTHRPFHMCVVVLALALATATARPRQLTRLRLTASTFFEPYSWWLVCCRVRLGGYGGVGRRTGREHRFI